MRLGRTGLAAALLVVAVVAALLAHDLLAWRNGVAAGDRELAVHPAAAQWTASTKLPLDPALHLLGLSSQLAYRRAAQQFVTVQALGNGVDNGYSESQQRGALEETLTKLGAGPDSARDSQAENLLGILAFADTQTHGSSAAAPVDRAVADFESAVQLDPGNVAAKFNLELLLRRLIARGVRPGSSGASSGPAKGHKGAGGGLPGRGY